ncbi:hypothetical protein NZK35_18255 [Stieleria sp. ICT_E10.1]|uniref:hypothetical protein n=1 Tax=Stieleria sedimenti TaxID=2976331 RepID=UPI00217FE75F|nr:hypothetical protein [Stieleria sedimenti]MCS7468600.1 hypothetical protein [Stieleria sedimenti]
MKLAQLSLLVAVVFTLGVGDIIHADDSVAAAKQPQQIGKWVEQLGHERLTERIKAEKKLIAAGKEAIPALAKAALAGNRATIEKSIDVLGKLAQSKHEKTQEAAKITLQMLSESDQPSTADRAKIALNTKEADGIKPFAGWNKPGNPFAGGGNLNRSVSTSNINGLRTISVKEGPLETTIQELRGGKILAQITGGEKNVELIAKNIEDLKKKLPEAAALYEQYAGGTQGLGMQFPGFGFGNIAVGQPAAKSNINIQGGGINGNVGSTEILKQQLTELKQRMGGNPLMQQMLDQQIRALSEK